MSKNSMMIKLTVPSYFTDYRTSEQRYNDNYLENFLYLRLLKHIKFNILNDENQNPIASNLIGLIEGYIKKNIDDIIYLNYYDGSNSYWSEKKDEPSIMDELAERKMKYTEMAIQKGGGKNEINYYKESKKVNSIKNYPSYAELIVSENDFDKTKSLIPEDLKKLTFNRFVDDGDLLNLLMGRNVDISTCNDNIRYILAESKYRSIRDSPIIPENDKVIECEKFKKTLKEIINENNDKCPNKIKMPDDSYWLNYHNNRSFYAVNYSCENFIVPVPYNKFAGDKVVMNMEVEESFETILNDIHNKCILLANKLNPSTSSESELTSETGTMDLLFGSSSDSSQIVTILRDLFLNKSFNPHEFIEYNSIEQFNSHRTVNNFLEYLLEYFRPENNMNEYSFDYNLQSPVVFSYTINNKEVVESSSPSSPSPSPSPPTLKPNFKCSKAELPENFNYDNYYFVNVPPYLKRGNYFQVNILPDGAIADNIFDRNKDNQSVIYQPKFIRFKVDNPSDKYSILLLNKTNPDNLTPAYYIQTVPIPTTDTKENTGKKREDLANHIIIELYKPGDGSLMSKLTQYAAKMTRTTLSQSLGQLYNEFQTYSQETQYNNATLSNLLNRYKLLETQFKDLPIYAKEESEYKTFIKHEYELYQSEYIEQTIKEVESYHKFAKTQKEQTFIYPNYPGLTTFYAPLNTPNKINNPDTVIEIIDDASKLIAPPPPYPRVDTELRASGKKSPEQLFQEEQEEQLKYNLSDAEFIQNRNAEGDRKIYDPARIITKYIGERNSNKDKDGYGVAYYKNGNKYEGRWANDTKDGAGISTEIVNYVTGEIGCVCKFYYNGFNILTNEYNYLEPNDTIKSLVDSIVAYSQNPELEKEPIPNFLKYVYTQNFAEEVEEEESRNSPSSSPSHIVRSNSVISSDSGSDIDDDES